MWIATPAHTYNIFKQHIDLKDKILGYYIPFLLATLKG